MTFQFHDKVLLIFILQIFYLQELHQAETVRELSPEVMSSNEILLLQMKSSFVYTHNVNIPSTY